MPYIYPLRDYIGPSFPHSLLRARGFLGVPLGESSLFGVSRRTPTPLLWEMPHMGLVLRRGPCADISCLQKDFVRGPRSPPTQALNPKP